MRATHMEDVRIVAMIRRSRGTVGPSSLDAGTPMPLDIIDKRLKDFRIFRHGDRPKTMLPQSREHYVHVMIEVIDDDPQPRPERFPRSGFYQVVGLRACDAGFLFELPCSAKRAGPKQTVGGADPATINGSRLARIKVRK